MKYGNTKLTKFFLIITSILLFLFILESLIWHNPLREKEALEKKQRIIIPINKLENE